MLEKITVRTGSFSEKMERDALLAS